MYNCSVRWYTVVDEMSVDEMSVYSRAGKNLRFLKKCLGFLDF